MLSDAPQNSPEWDKPQTYSLVVPEVQDPVTDVGLQYSSDKQLPSGGEEVNEALPFAGNVEEVVEEKCNDG